MLTPTIVQPPVYDAEDWSHSNPQLLGKNQHGFISVILYINSAVHK